MKKRMRIAALLTTGLLALTPCAAASMSLTAFAVEDTGPATEPTVTTGYNITVKATKKAEAAFDGYQIFTGKYEREKLTDIQWGTAIPETSRGTLLGELNGMDIFKVTIGETTKNLFDGLTGTSPAAAVAEAMGMITNTDIVDADTAKKMATELAKVIGKYATVKFDDTNTAANVIGGVPSGYYLIKESTPAAQDNPITLNLLKVLGGSVTVNTKEDLPTLEKLIDEKGGVDANTASIGDDVPFILKSKVPDMTGYTKYFFVMNDTLSKGLTYNNDLAIYVSGTQITADKYTVTTGGTDNTSIEIVFKDFYTNYKDLNDTDPNNDDIIVKYSAKVNANADMTQTGNTNIANLTYSNNPNEDAKPDDKNEDKPGPQSPTGVTPNQETVTYVTQIDLLKKDNSTPGNPLAGATFKLEGYLKTVGVSSGKYFVEDAAGTYYRLNDGSYKLVSEFVDGTDKYYESTHKKYKEVEVSAIPETSKISKEFTTGADGKINFAGLGEGVYTITEIEAPEGYNLPKDPFTVTITANATKEGCAWDKSLKDDNGIATAGAFIQGDKAGNKSSLPLTVINNPGSTLPSTGGIGTKLFFIFGAVMAIGSGIYLVTKKRMAGVEE